MTDYNPDNWVVIQMIKCSPSITKEQIEARAVELYGPKPEL